MSRQYDYRIIYTHAFDVQCRSIDERHPLAWVKLESFRNLKEAQKFVKESIALDEKGPQIIKEYFVEKKDE